MAPDPFVERSSDDERQIRLIFSPEDTEGFEHKDVVREFMSSVEEDLETRLDWIGVTHYNTDNPHTQEP